MSKSIKRAYNFGDDKMLQRSEMFVDALTDDLALFTARFPWLDGTWLTAVENDIDAADAFPKDVSTVLDIKVLTGDVGSTMQQGYAALLTLGVYAKLAWPQDLARQRVFGQDRWSDAHHNTLKLQEALELAHEKASQATYSAPLLAKGYTQNEIDELETFSEEIKLKNRLQEAGKSGRKVSVHDRVALLNVVWHHMQTINTCAEVVWAADAERLAQYQLYPSAGGTDTDTMDATISGTVYNAVNAMPLAGVTVKFSATIPEPTDTVIETITDDSGQYFLTIENLTEPRHGILEASRDGHVTRSMEVTATPGEELLNQDFVLEPAP